MPFRQSYCRTWKIVNCSIPTCLRQSLRLHLKIKVGLLHKYKDLYPGSKRMFAVLLQNIILLLFHLIIPQKNPTICFVLVFVLILGVQQQEGDLL